MHAELLALIPQQIVDALVLAWHHEHLCYQSHGKNKHYHQRESQSDNSMRLLLDSRVVDLPRTSNRIVVTLSSLKPFFVNGLKKELCFSDNVGA